MKRSYSLGLFICAAITIAACSGGGSTPASSPTAPTPAAPKQAALQISLSPDPVPPSTRTCTAGTRYSWDGVVTRIQETGGGTFTVTGWYGLFFDPATGEQSRRVDYTLDAFATYMSACGTGSTTIAANATACSNVGSCFASSSPSQKFQLRVEGRHADGTTATFSSQMITLAQ